MYQVKPVCGEIQADLPSCMYRVRNIHQPAAASAQQPCQNGEADPAIAALESRQDDIMRKLYELKAAVEGLAKTVATPDADLDSCSLSSHAPSSSSPSSSSSPFRGTADLDTLLGQDMGALRDIVINANPAQPPLTVLALHSLLCQRYRVLSAVHVHSSCQPGTVPPRLLSCLGPRHKDSYDRKRFQLGFTLIWKDVPQIQMKFSVQNMCCIEGEGSVCRFLYRLLSAYPSDPGAATLVDSWVDAAFWRLGPQGGAAGGGATQGGAAEGRRAQVEGRRALTAALGRHGGVWLCGAEPTLADIACYCCTLQSAQQSRVDMSASPANVQSWMKACSNLGHFDAIKMLLQ